MLTRALLLWTALLFSLAVQAQDGGLRERLRERLAERKPSAAPGQTTTSHTLAHGGLKRQYLVHLPRGYQAGRATPLLLAFHGGGGHMQLQASDESYGLISKSDSADFIVVFANGYSAFPGGKLATWNAGNCCGDARDKQIDDVGFVRALVARLQAELSIDPQRIYATGMSNGGMLAHRLACEAADVFKAVAAVAGTDNTRDCRPSRPVSVLHIHARNDDHVLFEGGAGPNAFRDESKVTAFTSVPETIARWIRRDACPATPPVRVLDKPGAYCEHYSGCGAGSQVQLCVTDTGGHSWPGASKVRGGKEPASQALSANDVMWDFFSQLP